MEEDDEIQSHMSPGSDSPANFTPAGRITVTVAAAAPVQQTPEMPAELVQSALTLALPIQTVRNGGREDCWSEAATAVLIEAWGERYLELSRGNLKQKHWKEVADMVSAREDYRKTPKTDIQCKNRIDTVKKKYKLEKTKLAAGGPPSKWRFYDRLDYLIGPTGKPSPGHAVALPNASAQLQKVPMGIPVGVRGVSPFRTGQRDVKPLHAQEKSQSVLMKRRIPAAESPSSDDDSPASTDSFPMDQYERKRPRTARDMNLNAKTMGFPPNLISKLGERGKEKKGGALRELTRAIVKFGEAYEQAERSKLQQITEMETQRMKFARDVEMQRMQFFMKTQREMSQAEHGGRRGVGVGNAGNHHSQNNSDSSN